MPRYRLKAVSIDQTVPRILDAVSHSPGICPCDDVMRRYRLRVVSKDQTVPRILDAVSGLNLVYFLH